MGLLSTLLGVKKTSSAKKSDSLSDSLSDPLAGDAMVGGQLGKGWVDNRSKTELGAVEAWKEQEGVRITNSWTVAEALGKYRHHFMILVDREHSHNNVEAYEAIKGGVTPRSAYHTWLKEGVPDEVNLPKKVRAVYDQLAEQDRYDEMDLGPARAEIEMCIVDTMSRAVTDTEFQESLQASLVPPAWLGGPERKQSLTLRGAAKKADAWLTKTLTPKDAKQKIYDAHIHNMKLDDWFGPYKDILVSQARMEFAMENVMCMDAIRTGAPARTIYELFVAAGSPMEVNLPKATYAELAEHASNRNWSGMDFTNLKGQLVVNLSDTLSRAKIRDDFTERFVADHRG